MFSVLLTFRSLFWLIEENEERIARTKFFQKYFQNVKIAYILAYILYLFVLMEAKLLTNL